MSGPWLLYGVTGYTGELIARRARAQGERPVLAGRSAGAVAGLAGEPGFEHRVLALGGTATTMVENLHRGGAVRRDGRIVPVPAAWKTRVIDFGRGPVKAMTIPWGDVATAYHTTGIPNIEVYMAAPASMRWMMRLARPLGPLLATKPVQSLLKSRIQSGPRGPGAEHRARARSFLWGEASD